MDLSYFYMPIQKVIEFMQIPINIGGFEFSIFAFLVTTLAMNIFLTILFRFFLD